MSARRFSAKTFDWPLFFKNFPFQPVPIWVACALIVGPLARATPWLLRASCAGAERRAAANLALIVYANVLPPLTAAAAYLLAGRRRITHPHHRMIGDATLALCLVVSAFTAISMARLLTAAWPTLGPGLSVLRASCWP